MQVPRKKRRIWPLVLICVLILVLAVCIVTAVLLNSLILDIQLNGEREITLQYGESYTDQGAIAALRSDLLRQFSYDVPVQVSEIPEFTAPGKYSITYEAKILWLETSAERIVTVVDGEAPVITLMPDPPGKFTLPGQPYEEEGYTATDNCDGDITDKVQRTVTETEVIYTVTDSSGNTTEVRRPIVYGDPVPPVLTLVGDASMTIPIGTAFTEPGYTATDNADGDLTSQVQVSGSVKMYIPGTYTIVYTVTDSFGNVTTVTRDVLVVSPANVEHLVPGNKVVYLTFDDGPSAFTEKLLAVLAKYNAKATFFVCENSKYNSVMKQIVDGGHAIGVHSKTHNYQEIYASEDAYLADFNAMRQIILEQSGVNTTLFRFPGGSSNSVSKFNQGIMTRLTKLMTDMGYHYFDWNVSSGDAGAGATSVEAVFNNVIAGIQNQKVPVVLQHDINEYSVEAVESILIWGLQNGCTFQALDENSPTCHHPVNN